MTGSKSALGIFTGPVRRSGFGWLRTACLRLTKKGLSPRLAREGKDGLTLIESAGSHSDSAGRATRMTGPKRRPSFRHILRRHTSRNDHHLRQPNCDSATCQPPARAETDRVAIQRLDKRPDDQIAGERNGT